MFLRLLLHTTIVTTPQAVVPLLTSYYSTYVHLFFSPSSKSLLCNRSLMSNVVIADDARGHIWMNLNHVLYDHGHSDRRIYHPNEKEAKFIFNASLVRFPTVSLNCNGPKKHSLNLHPESAGTKNHAPVHDTRRGAFQVRKVVHDVDNDKPLSMHGNRAIARESTALDQFSQRQLNNDSNQSSDKNRRSNKSKQSEMLSADAPTLLSGCVVTTQSPTSDDDGNGGHAPTNVSVHCASAGLTSVPYPLPSSTQYL